MPRYDLNIKREFQSGVTDATAEPFVILKNDSTVLDIGESDVIVATIMSPEGGIINTTIVTDVDSDGYIVVTLDTTDMAIEENYILDFTVTQSETNYRSTFLFDVVKKTFRNVLTLNDLSPNLPNAIEETNLIRYIQQAVSYVRNKISQGVLYNGYEFELSDSQVKLQKRRERIIPARIMNPETFFFALKNCAQWFYFTDAANASDISLSENRDYYKREFETEFKAAIANMLYDFDDDGYIDDTEKEPLVGDMFQQ